MRRCRPTRRHRLIGVVLDRNVRPHGAIGKVDRPALALSVVKQLCQFVKAGRQVGQRGRFAETDRSVELVCELLIAVPVPRPQLGREAFGDLGRLFDALVLGRDHAIAGELQMGPNVCALEGCDYFGAARPVGR